MLSAPEGKLVVPTGIDDVPSVTVLRTITAIEIERCGRCIAGVLLAIGVYTGGAKGVGPCVVNTQV